MSSRVTNSEVQAGGDAAFEEIVRKYSRLVYGAALRRVNNAHLAEDVTQSVFIILHQKLPTLNQNVSILGWLIRATQFVASRAAKAEARRLASEARSIEHFEIAAQPDSAEAIFPLLGEALVALKPKEERCVTARFIEEASFKEIADRERISEDAAQKRVTRSLEKMRAFLARRGLRIASAAILPAIFTRLTHAADPALVSGIIQSVTAGKAAAPITLSLVLAKKAAVILAWKEWLFVSAKLATLLIVVSMPVTWVAVNRKPPTPPAIAIPPPVPQIASLANQWSKVVRDVAVLIRTPPPAANTRAATRYNATYSQVISDTTRIANEFNALLDAENERMASAQFLALELKENLHLDGRQEAVVFRIILGVLVAAPSLKDGLNQLYQNRAAQAPQLRAMLSLRQQWLFDSTYRRDGFGLFAFGPTLATGQ